MPVSKSAPEDIKQVLKLVYVWDIETSWPSNVYSFAAFMGPIFNRGVLFNGHVIL